MFWNKKPSTPAAPQQAQVPDAEALQSMTLSLFEYFNATYPGWKSSDTNFKLKDDKIESFTSLVDQAPKILDFPVVEQVNGFIMIAFSGLQMPKMLSLTLDSVGRHQFNFGY